MGLRVLRGKCCAVMCLQETSCPVVHSEEGPFPVLGGPAGLSSHRRPALSCPPCPCPSCAVELNLGGFLLPPVNRQTQLQPAPAVYVRTRTLVTRHPGSLSSLLLVGPLALLTPDVLRKRMREVDPVSVQRFGAEIQATILLELCQLCPGRAAHCPPQASLCHEQRGEGLGSVLGSGPCSPGL